MSRSIRKMDLYSLQSFYNNARKPLTPTTLHSGNISAAAYESVTFIRKLMCREVLADARNATFCSGDHDKENSPNKSTK